MSRATVLARAQAAAEAGMRDTATIRRVTGQTTSATGVVTDTLADVYTGKCRLQLRGLTSEARTVGEAYLMVSRIELQLPVSAPLVREGDKVTVTASVNAALAGRRFVVQAAPDKSEESCRRATLLEVTS